MAPVETIQITGLREFVRDLRKLDAEAPKQIKLVANRSANMLVDVVKPRVPTGPAKGGHAVNSIKAASTRTAARVSGGSKRYPYYAWLDFGGKTGRPGTPARPFYKKGRFIWLAFSEHRDDIERDLRHGLMEAARDAGLDPELG